MIFESFILSLVLIIFHVIIVSILLRLFPKLFPIAIHAFSALCQLIILLWLIVMDFNFNYWFVFCILSFGISTYLFLFGAVYKSLSLRFLLAIKAEGGAVSLMQLEQKITIPSFTQRVTLLCEMGCITQNQKGMYISTKGKRMANKINTLKKLFHVETIGMYNL